MELIRRNHRPVSLTDMAAALGKGSVLRDAVVVTFDDGYADNLEVALPLLEQYEIPATFFVAAGYIGARREFWWDELERVVNDSGHLPPRLHLKAHSNPPFFWRGDTGDPIATVSLIRALHAFLLPLDSEERDHLISQLRAIGGTPAESRPANSIMTEGQLRRLASHPLAEVGAHTMTHPLLSAVSADDERREIDDSRRNLEAITGKPVTSFAYPFGYEGSWDAESRAAVAAAGFERACTTEWRPVRRGTDLFALPRLFVTGWDAAQLERVLRTVG